MATDNMYTIRGNVEPARHAIRCIGGNSDDEIQVNAAAVALTAFNDLVGTWTAVVMCGDITSTMTIIGAGDDNVVEFIELNIEAGLVTARCTDGTVAQFVTQADAVVIEPFKWHHIAMVQRADGAGPHLFVDGVEIARTNDTATDVNEWFVNCDGIDTMSIGAANKDGASGITNEFKGFISDVRIYRDAKTAEEIYAIYEYDMFKIGSNNTTNLHNHWDWINDLVDNGSGDDNGTAVSGATRMSWACEFTARLNWEHGLTLLTADHPRFIIDKGVGYALITDAA
jgi:hypothetical protein